MEDISNIIVNYIHINRIINIDIWLVPNYIDFNKQILNNINRVFDNYF